MILLFPGESVTGRSPEELWCSVESPPHPSSGCHWVGRFHQDSSWLVEGRQRGLPWGLLLQVRKRMEMKMRRPRQLRANGQLKMMRWVLAWVGVGIRGTIARGADFGGVALKGFLILGRNRKESRPAFPELWKPLEQPVPGPCLCPQMWGWAPWTAGALTIFLCAG